MSDTLPNTTRAGDKEGEKHRQLEIAVAAAGAALRAGWCVLKTTGRSCGSGSLVQRGSRAALLRPLHQLVMLGFVAAGIVGSFALCVVAPLQLQRSRDSLCSPCCCASHLGAAQRPAFLPQPGKDSYLLPAMVILRVIFIPLFMLCNVQPRDYLPVVFSHDAWYIIFMIFFSISNGYLASLCMCFGPK